MQKRTRLFLVIAAAILVAGLGTGLVAAYRGGFQNLVLIGGEGPDELAYVPRDARMVAYADIGAIMRSGLRQKLHPPQNTPGDPADQFHEQTGINLETDVDHVLAWSTGAASGAAAAGAGGAVAGSPQERPLLLARGRFDVVRLEGVVREHDGTVEDYKGTRVITQPRQQFALAFVEPGLVAVGTIDAVHRAIDTKAAPRTSTIRDNADVMRLVKDVDDGTAWAVARLDAITASGKVPGDVVKQLPAVNWFAVTGHIDDGVRGSVRAEARDEEAAKNLSDVIRGFMALARMQLGQRGDFTNVLNSLQLSSSGKTVTLTFDVPREVFDALAAMHRPGAPGLPHPDAPRQPRQDRGAGSAPAL